MMEICELSENYKNNISQLLTNALHASSSGIE